MIYYIRHGESIANVHTYTHWSLLDPELTEKGKIQCYETKQLLKNVNFEIIICSPLKRSIQSASLLFPNRIIYCFPEVSEIGFGLDNFSNYEPFGFPYVIMMKEPLDYLLNNSYNKNIAIISHEHYIELKTNKKLKNMEFTF
tara:strand:- start:1906 stop:2331 length:426 start_codon:yes stop_codon:yes gene_type:complete